MHEFRHIEDLIFLHIHALLDAVEAGAARLQVSDANDIVIGHGDGDVFGCRLGQSIGMQFAAMFAICGKDACDSIQIFVGIGDVLKIHQPFDAGIE